MPRESILIPPAEGRGFAVDAGEEFRVVDVAGSQVADFVAFDTENAAEATSPAETVQFNHPRYRLKPGDFFYSNYRRPMFEIVADDAGGVHDFLYAACNPVLYEALGFPGHPNCSDNLVSAISTIRPVHHYQLPSPINLFQDTYPGPDGKILLRPSPTRAGDAITLRAMRACLVAVTSCAYDLDIDGDLNGDGPTPIRIEFR